MSKPQLRWQLTHRQAHRVLKRIMPYMREKNKLAKAQEVMDYYNKNKEAVRKITRFDILNMQYWLPRWMLEIPYDILNRFNRQNLQDDNEEIVNTVVHTDYSISESNNECLDHFCIATK